MTDSEGIVTRLEGEFAWVEVGEASGCGNCEQQGSCGGDDLFGLRAARRQQRIHNGIGARVGDAVIVSLPDGAVLMAAWAAYLLPLLLGIGGAALGNFWGGADIHAFVGLVVGLLVGVALLRRSGNRQEPAPALRIKHHVMQFSQGRLQR